MFGKNLLTGRHADESAAIRSLAAYSDQGPQR